MTVEHLNPFSLALEYRKQGWLGTLPLPYGKKNSPPGKEEDHDKRGWTGSNGRYPTKKEVENWINAGQRNICLRLAGVTQELEIIAIDVDNYGDKKGGETLQALEEKLGALPPTYVCSAKNDGISGHRYFLVPRGLHFRGSLGIGLDVIQKSHRYSVAAPSLHPDGQRYRWYRQGEGAVDGIPDARTLPLLPPAWLEWMQDGKQGHDDADLTSSGEEILSWMWKNLPDVGGEMCEHMHKKLEVHMDKIRADPTSHDKFTSGHWNLLCFATEGHIGVGKAIDAFNDFWVSDVVDRNKRSAEEIQGEFSRSYFSAIRKIKKEVDLGKRNLLTRCDAGYSLEAVWRALEPPPVPFPMTGPIRPVGDYEATDDGNAQHLFDRFCGAGIYIRWVTEWKRFILWNHVARKWVVDDEDGSLIRSRWSLIKELQFNWVEICRQDWEAQVALNAGVSPIPVSVKIAKATYDKWHRWAERSGSNHGADNAIRRFGQMVRIDAAKLDANPRLLGTPDGVVELGADGARRRDAVPEDLVTMSTAVAWGEDNAHSSELWQGYLDKFLPDLERRKKYQILLGYSLLGGNKDRIFAVFLGPTSTGKSNALSIPIATLGDYGGMISKSSFQAAEARFKTSLKLHAKARMVGCPEFDSATSMNGAVIKEMSGGDAIDTEVKGKDAIQTIRPDFIPCIATNSMPSIKDPDEALKRRLYVLPFEEKIDRADEINLLDMMNKVGFSAVFNWMVEGWNLYCQSGSGLIRDEETDRYVDDAMADLDPFAEFIRDNVEEHKEFKTRKWSAEQWVARSPRWCVGNKELVEAVRRWWQQNEIPQPFSPQIVRKRFSEYGFVRTQKQVRVMSSNGIPEHQWGGFRLAVIASVTDISTAVSAVTRKPREGE